MTKDAESFQQNQLGFRMTDELLIYKTPDTEVRVEILIHDENLWLTQDKIAQLFGVQRPAITKHLGNIFTEGELEKEAVCSKMEHTASDGKTYQTNFYNLDAIISVGYRINSRQATLFRIWATQVLKEYLKKGYVMDDDRLKNPEYVFGKDYFEEQLERIRDIRSSERRFYQKITDIYAQCSSDYDKNAEITRQFYATVQNKMHELNLLVSAYLDFAELQAKRGVLMTMQDWVGKLDEYLRMSNYGILEGKGERTAAQAKAHAMREFDAYHGRVLKEHQSDFDLLIEEGFDDSDSRAESN